MGGVRKRVVLAFFGCLIMTSSPPQRAKILAQSLVVEALIDFLAFLVPKYGSKDPKSLRTSLSNFRGSP